MSRSELIPGTNLLALNELHQREIGASVFSSNALKHMVQVRRT